MYRELRIRPLSEGLGIGTLRAPEKNEPPQIESMPKIETMENISRQTVSFSGRQQAQAAYAPHSVATNIRGRKTVKIYVKGVRFIAGLGADVVAAVLTALMLSWIAVFAWNAGYEGVVDPTAALHEIVSFLLHCTIAQYLLGTAIAIGCWTLVKTLFSKS